MIGGCGVDSGAIPSGVGRYPPKARYLLTKTARVRERSIQIIIISNPKVTNAVRTIGSGSLGIEYGSNGGSTT